MDLNLEDIISDQKKQIESCNETIKSLSKQNDKLRIEYAAEFEAFKMSFRNRSIRRLNVLEEWLTEYRNKLKKENAFHKNTRIINAINKLLDETSTDI